MQTFEVESQASRSPEPSKSAERGFDPDALTRALRIAGAALVVASASTFMLQHWGGGNDLIRYAMLVGQSLLLAAAAYFVGLTLREGRSARTFLGLLLGTVPISFAVLGGLVYSQFHLEAVPMLPSYATWVAPSPLAAVLAVLATLVVLTPLSVVSFVALGRREAKALTLAFMAANLLIIVPMRQPLAVVALAGVALIALVRLELTRFGACAQLDTLEGKVARVMPFAAPLIMLGRVFHLYQVRGTFVGGLCLVGASVLWLLLAKVSSTRLRDVGAWAAALVGLLGWCFCGSELGAQLHAGTAAQVLLWGVPASLVLCVASRRAEAARGSLLGAATALGLGTTLVASVIDWSSIGAGACIVVGVAVSVWGAATRGLWRTVAGALVALFGLLVEVWLATHTDNVLRWLGLSVVGVLLIVGSAYVERNRARLVRFWGSASSKRLVAEEA
jgi:hypothetical protein